MFLPMGDVIERLCPSLDVESTGICWLSETEIPLMIFIDTHLLICEIWHVRFFPENIYEDNAQGDFC